MRLARHPLLAFPLLLLVMAFALAACGSDPTATAVPTPAPTAMMGDESKGSDAMMDDEDKGSDAMMAEPQLQTLVSGWYQGRQVDYYDFGANTPLVAGAPSVAPIYVFVHGTNADGSPNFVEGQHNIVDVVPGDDGYSDLWQVMLVTVPDGYMPDSIRSMADLTAQNLNISPTDIFVNCPIVPEGTSFEGGEELTQGWYKDEPVFYPDFGPNDAVAIPIWAFITGMDAEGNPQFIDGQNNIIDSVPGDAGYSAFWQVNLVTVPEGYEPNSIRSAADLAAAGHAITATDILVNCPVTMVAAG